MQTPTTPLSKHTSMQINKQNKPTNYEPKHPKLHTINNKRIKQPKVNYTINKQLQQIKPYNPNSLPGPHSQRIRNQVITSKTNKPKQHGTKQAAHHKINNNPQESQQQLTKYPNQLISTTNK